MYFDGTQSTVSGDLETSGCVFCFLCLDVSGGSRMSDCTFRFFCFDDGEDSPALEDVGGDVGGDIGDDVAAEPSTFSLSRSLLLGVAGTVASWLLVALSNAMVCSSVKLAFFAMVLLGIPPEMTWSNLVADRVFLLDVEV